MQPWQYKPAHDLHLPPDQRLRSLQRESGLLGTLSHLAWWSAVRLFLLATESITIKGRHHIPSPPFILASNHCSHLDILVLATALPLKLRASTFPIAAGDTFFETLPMSAFSAGLMNALPMWRKNCGRHAIEQLRARLASDPISYILFPEGTRSRTGALAPFKPGLGMLVASTPTPILPCHLAGTHTALPPGKRFPRRTQITLTIAPPLSFPTTPNTREGWQHIAESLHSTIASLAPKP